MALADLAAAAAALSLILEARGNGVGLISLLTLPLVVLIAKVSGCYDHDELVLHKSTLDEVPRLVGVAAGFALTWSVVVFLAGLQLHLGGAGIAALWASTALMLIVARSGARMLAQSTAPPERILIAGDPTSRTRLAHSLSCDPAAHVDVVGFLPLDEDEDSDLASLAGPNGNHALRIDDIASVVRDVGVDRVVFISPGTENETLLNAVSNTAALGIKVSIVPRLLEVVGSAVEFDTVGGMTVLGVRRPGLTRSSWIVKRAMDLVGAGIGVLLLAPFGLLIAFAIKLDSPGPVLFRQRRVGKDGRIFHMIKFRSMVSAAEQRRAELEELNETDGLFKLSADPRVTRVGRLLRRASIDELPQLLNVLRGEMSLVGPRPLVLDEDRLIAGRHRQRLQLAPGMTGPWQVLGPERPPLAEMVKTDYLYAANWSLWSDIKILVRTFAHVLGMRGV